MSERIIVAEDDEDLAFVLREALDVRLPDMDGLDAIPRRRELAPAITRGAYDFFTKPLKMEAGRRRAVWRAHLDAEPVSFPIPLVYCQR